VITLLAVPHPGYVWNAVEAGKQTRTDSFLQLAALAHPPQYANVPFQPTSGFQIPVHHFATAYHTPITPCFPQSASVSAAPNTCSQSRPQDDADVSLSRWSKNHSGKASSPRARRPNSDRSVTPERDDALFRILEAHIMRVSQMRRDHARPDKQHRVRTPRAAPTPRPDLTTPHCLSCGKARGGRYLDMHPPRAGIGAEPCLCTKCCDMLFLDGDMSVLDRVGLLFETSKSLFPFKHFCAVCGKRRSEGYHYDHETDHDLQTGEVPKPKVCRRCRAEARREDADEWLVGRLRRLGLLGKGSCSSGRQPRADKSGSLFEDRERIVRQPNDAGSEKPRHASRTTVESAASRASGLARRRGFGDTTQHPSPACSSRESLGDETVSTGTQTTPRRSKGEATREIPSPSKKEAHLDSRFLVSDE
jgi:hypothetical protein